MNAVLKATLAAAPVLLAAACAQPSPRAEAPSPRTAATAKPLAPRITKFADANKDGKITREEAGADPNLARDFDQYDKDKNGVLDRGEFEKLSADAQERTVVDTDADPVGDEGIRGFSSGLNRTGR